MRPAILVFRPRAGTWLFAGFLSLVIALNSLFWFFDPQPIIVRYLGGAGIIVWVSYLVSLGQARVELRESTVEVYGPSFQVLHPRELHWFHYLLLLLVISDLAALFLGPSPLWAQRFLLAVRIVWLFGYLWCFGVLEGGRRSVKYTEITTAPWERRLTALSIKTALDMETSSGTNFLFPSWLNHVDQSEVAGRVTARMKHAQALQKAQETNRGAATAVADAPAPP